MKLGLDLFSLRRQGWTIFQHLDYCRQIGLDAVMIPDPDFLERLDDDYLDGVKAHAGRLGLELEYGMYSICPTSNAFSDKRGTAVEQLQLNLHVAHRLGSRYLRALLGNNGDRRGPLSLRQQIDNTIGTLRTCRQQALDLGIRVAIENHAGDLQARELKALIQEAGPDFVGACIDSGNSLWVAESPFVTLEHLAPYVLMSHIRDSVVCPHPRGALYQWVAMGDGTINIADWARRYQEQCPHANFTLEIISSLGARVLNYLEPDFWTTYPEMPAWEFARFLELVEQGSPHTGLLLTAEWSEPDPAYQAALVVQQRRQVEKSVKYCREVLGIGAGPSAI
jgi:sugar phosphate isomerase/epimerase